MTDNSIDMSIVRQIYLYGQELAITKGQTPTFRQSWRGIVGAFHYETLIQFYRKRHPGFGVVVLFEEQEKYIKEYEAKGNFVRVLKTFVSHIDNKKKVQLVISISDDAIKRAFDYLIFLGCFKEDDVSDRIKGKYLVVKKELPDTIS